MRCNCIIDATWSDSKLVCWEDYGNLGMSYSLVSMIITFRMIASACNWRSRHTDGARWMLVRRPCTIVGIGSASSTSRSRCADVSDVRLVWGRKLVVSSDKASATSIAWGLIINGRRDREVPINIDLLSISRSANRSVGVIISPIATSITIKVHRLSEKGV